LRNRLQAVVGHELSAAIALEYPTIELLATFLVEQLATPGHGRPDNALDDIGDQQLMRMLTAELERDRV
jgi:hypothetical protein